MKKHKKAYETPVILPLGELARGLGAPCNAGSVPTGQCAGGAGVPPAACANGGRASGTGSTCTKGGQVGRP
jgi:hypothetical protein